MFVTGKLFCSILTNTSLVQTFINYGQKSFITLAPGQAKITKNVAFFLSLVKATFKLVKIIIAYPIFAFAVIHCPEY
jgi:hypothetical protein